MSIDDHEVEERQESAGRRGFSVPILLLGIAALAVGIAGYLFFILFANAMDDTGSPTRPSDVPFGLFGRALVIALAAYLLAVAPRLWHRTESLLRRVAILVPHALILVPPVLFTAVVFLDVASHA